MYSFSKCSRTIILITFLLLPGFLHAANLPLTDLILYGKVYQKTTHTPVVGTLAGPVTVKVTSVTSPTDTVISSTAELLDAGSGTKEFYVLRLKRFETGTVRVAGDTFVLPGDRIRVYLNGLEVSETEAPIVLATDAVQDIRLLALNAPPGLLDTDGDGLPDSWEQQFFGNLAAGLNDDANKDGVTNFQALFGGLNPNQNNGSNMPFLQMEAGGAMVFYFRQSTADTGITYTVQASTALSGAGSWVPLTGITPQQVSATADSRLLKVTVPKSGPARFYRLSLVK